jgi:predicted secreted protein
MGATDFQVVVRSSWISPEDLAQASTVAESELPKLMAEQRRLARQFKISEEEYARAERARRYAEERIRARGQQLGEIVGRTMS